MKKDNLVIQMKKLCTKYHFGNNWKKSMFFPFNIFKERPTSQLTNLYCPTMSDYIWYKDNFFLSKITLREDKFAGYWKERFLVGLPKLE